MFKEWFEHRFSISKLAVIKEILISSVDRMAIIKEVVSF
jgi:hypothetical protein